MFDNVLHVVESLHSITESFHVFLLRLHGPSHDDFLKLGGLFAWAETLTVIAAAYMKRMIPLRALAMLANVFGFAVSLFTGSFAGFSKHAVNFPLNATRLLEMRRLIASVREAGATDLNVEWLKPFMHPRAFKAGQPVFSKGDAASEAFVLVEGRIIVPERSAVLEPGAIFGEMALFTADSRRTASAVCASDVRLLVITYEQFEQLYYQNPEFGLYLVRLIVRRYEMNHVEPGAATVSAIAERQD